jgi:enamine deaminase RidA (YjgF/YER057c/UK114 family)
MDVDGMNAAYALFFGTPQQPNRPARATVQVAGLVWPGWAGGEDGGCGSSG